MGLAFDCWGTGGVVALGEPDSFDFRGLVGTGDLGELDSSWWTRLHGLGEAGGAWGWVDTESSRVRTRGLASGFDWEKNLSSRFMKGDLGEHGGIGGKDLYES